MTLEREREGGRQLSVFNDAISVPKTVIINGKGKGGSTGRNKERKRKGTRNEKKGNEGTKEGKKE